MGDLFDEAAGRRLETVAPLAQRLRPATLDDFVGQEHVVGPGRALRLAIEADRVPSLVLFGPPGTGKTTLARIVAGVTGAEFEELSAVSATVGERARGARRGPASGSARPGGGRSSSSTRSTASTRPSRTRSCPGVEDGLVTLIGATTENPYFELNSALLSRMQVYELEALTRRASCARSSGAAPRELGVELAPEVEELIAAPRRRRRAKRARDPRARRADGRRPRAPRRPCATSRTPPASGRSSTTRAATRHYDTISAWIKSTRASDVQASVYYLAVMLEGGEDAALHRPPDDRARLRGHRQRRPAGAARRRRRRAGGRARRPARGAAQPRPGRRLPRARAEVERLLPRARRRGRRRPRARPPPPARRAPLGRLPGRREARPRRGLRLPARRPGRASRSTASRRAQGARLLHAVRERRGRRTG